MRGTISVSETIWWRTQPLPAALTRQRRTTRRLCCVFKEAYTSFSLSLHFYSPKFSHLEEILFPLCGLLPPTRNLSPLFSLLALTPSLSCAGNFHHHLSLPPPFHPPSLSLLIRSSFPDLLYSSLTVPAPGYVAAPYGKCIRLKTNKDLGVTVYHRSTGDVVVSTHNSHREVPYSNPGRVEAIWGCLFIRHNSCSLSENRCWT